MTASDIKLVQKWLQEKTHTSPIVNKFNNSGTIGFNDSSNKIITLTCSISCS